MTELEQSNITRHGRDAHALPSLPPGRTGKGRTEEGEGERANGQEREKKDVAVDIKADLKEMRRRGGPNNISREEPGRSDLMIGAFFN